MMRPAWRTYSGIVSLTREVKDVVRIAQIVPWGRKWRLTVRRADLWGTDLDVTIPTKREAKRRGEVALDLEPTPDLLPPVPTLSQIRATAHIRGIEIDDEGDRYEAFAPKGKCFSGDLHSLVHDYDEGDAASKRSARSELFDDIKQPLEPCDPESDNCRACGCFPDSK